MNDILSYIPSVPTIIAAGVFWAAIDGVRRSAAAPAGSRWRSYGFTFAWAAFMAASFVGYSARH